MQIISEMYSTELTMVLHYKIEVHHMYANDKSLSGNGLAGYIKRAA